MFVFGYGRAGGGQAAGRRRRRQAAAAACGCEGRAAAAVPSEQPRRAKRLCYAPQLPVQSSCADRGLQQDGRPPGYERAGAVLGRRAAASERRHAPGENIPGRTPGSGGGSRLVGGCAGGRLRRARGSEALLKILPTVRTYRAKLSKGRARAVKRIQRTYIRSVSAPLIRRCASVCTLMTRSRPGQRTTLRPIGHDI